MSTFNAYQGPANFFFPRAYRVPAAAPAASAFGIASQQMRDGTVSIAYTDTVIAVGGFAPITFAVTSGALPTSLSLNSSTGVVSGTPTVAASSTFTVTGTDSHGNTTSQSFTVVVSAASSGGEVSHTFIC